MEHNGARCNVIFLENHIMVERGSYNEQYTKTDNYKYIKTLLESELICLHFDVNIMVVCYRYLIVKSFRSFGLSLNSVNNDTHTKLFLRNFNMKYLRRRPPRGSVL